MLKKFVLSTYYLQLQPQLLAFSRLYSDQKLIFILKMKLRPPSLIFFYLKMSRYFHINLDSQNMSEIQGSYNVISLSH